MKRIRTYRFDTRNEVLDEIQAKRTRRLQGREPYSDGELLGRVAVYWDVQEDREEGLGFYLVKVVVDRDELAETCLIRSGCSEYFGETEIPCNHRRPCGTLSHVFGMMIAKAIKGLDPVARELQGVEI